MDLETLYKRKLGCEERIEIILDEWHEVVCNPNANNRLKKIKRLKAELICENESLKVYEYRIGVFKK